MEELIKEQQDLGKQLINLITNIKKDPIARRTVKHLQKRKTEVVELYDKYRVNDKQLITYEGIADLPYAEERVQIQRAYENITSEINSKMETAPTTPITPTPLEQPSMAELKAIENKTLQPPTTTTKALPTVVIPANPNTNTEPIKKLLRKQLIKINHLQSVISQAFGIIKEQKEPEYLKQKLNQVNIALVKIDDLHEEIQLEATEEDIKNEIYFVNSLYFEITNLAEDCAAKLQQALNKWHNNNEPIIDQHQYKLKKIEIPKFSGNYQNWVGFHELFSKLVDQNCNLTDTHRMMYLKMHLEGAASKVIQHLQPIGDNYKSALEILTTRYQNKRLLVNNHINAIFALHNAQHESASAIRILHDSVRENLHAVKNLGVDTTSWGAWLVPYLTRKLDNETIKAYEMSLQNPKDIQTTNGFLEFLEQRYQTLENLKLPKITVSIDSRRNNNYQQHTFSAVALKTSSCILCSDNHKLEYCYKFIKMNNTDRTQLINLHELCRRCLNAGHSWDKCSSQSKCKQCNGMHHELLHTKPPSTTFTKKVATNSATQSTETTLLATAIVKTKRFDGRDELLRLLIDTGSQTSFITTEAKQRLNLVGHKISAEVHGVGGQIAERVTSIVNIQLQPRYTSTFSIEIEVLVLAKISKNLPDAPFESTEWNHLNELLLADPNYNIPAPIDILLGADYYSQIVKPQFIKGNKNEPAAQLTEFGWVVLGRIRSPRSATKLEIKSHITSVEIDEQLKKFWEIEELHPPRNHTSDEHECEEHFRINHRRGLDGRYTVKIPLHQQTNTETQLGDSKKMATARLLQLEKQLSRNDELAMQYKKFIQEYELLGHLQKVTPTMTTSEVYYMPHQAVLKPSSTTTKLRVVFDASAKTTNGRSLNDIMYVGPKLQQDLWHVVMRWRKHKYVVTADIEKMFRQIWVDEKDRNFQRILWRKSTDEKIEEYQLKTVTYGTAAATYLAAKTLHQLAEDEKEKYPVASRITLKDFYVDDLLTGADTFEETLEAQLQLIHLLKGGGFNLRKWASNNQELVAHLPVNAREGGSCPIKSDDTIKTLGITWNPNLDVFEFKISSSPNIREPTKRNILAEVTKLFDPLGWFAPVIIQAKLLMQNLWIAGVDWDEKISTELQQQWFQIKESLREINNITIPRWIEQEVQGKNELHGFSDASEKAFAAVVYYKTTNPQGKPATYLITAKTKVAHLKTRISLPRLELCGAVLLARLLKTVQDAMDLKHTTVYAWTDSMITLGWIKGNPNKYKTFVGNRIAEIQSLLHPSQWHYVKSNCNPADVASRGANARQLQDNQLWWNGPDWLKTSDYPLKLQPTEEAANEELKINCLLTNTNASTASELIDFTRFSSALKMKRTVAYCYRFITILQKRIKRVPEDSPSFLTGEELSKADNTIVRIIQGSEFAAELRSIKITGKIKYNSKLVSLNPFIDKNGLLRVGGRLQKSQLKFDQKHQLILPKNHVYAKLIAQEAHHLLLHGGIQTTLAQIRTKYWILNGKSLVRATIHSCVKCFRFRRVASQQLMGMLPEARVTPSAPFTNTGIDYAGPFAIRVSKGRGNKSYKGYIALFVCFSTKAIHLELVSELTTAAFLAAFKRFTARRGTPLNIYSDNGTNFVGARNELDKELKLAIQQSNYNAAQQAANHGTNWHFIPAGSPHFGGIWESGIKSTKTHLKKVIGETTLTYEEFSTVLTQIEACLNSRPIHPLSSDLNDYNALTPGHFLIGRPIISPPESDKTNITASQRWNLLSKVTQGFLKK